MADLPRNVSITQRRIGAVVPVGALRGVKSVGVGEFLDLLEFAELCSKMHVGIIQLLPVNDTGYESSPYSALSAFALHPLYLRIGALPELRSFEGSRFFEKLDDLKNRFEGKERYPFQEILREKLALLRDIFDEFRDGIMASAESGSLKDWIARNPWVKEYAVYRQLKEANQEKSWREWEDYQDAGAEAIETLWNNPETRGSYLFWAWVQEALDGQFSEAASAVRERGMILEGDLPILINGDSCDVWAHRDYFNMDFSAGAPPDMYSPEGQNWGFPIYNWGALEKSGYEWWRQRLKCAEKYYQAYRIDHVLGFFRIWAAPRGDNTSALGRFIPFIPIKKQDLTILGFDDSRIRWLSKPHIPTGEVWSAVGAQGIDASAVDKIFYAALDRIGNEELWLFKDHIGGEKDIINLDLHQAAKDFLIQAWHNRLFYEYEPGLYVPTWYYRNSRGYQSLSTEERRKLEALVEKTWKDSERIWEREGKKLLSVLTSSSSMLPCAEDLGAVPSCVPATLKHLKILGLRVVRWHRDWAKEGNPYIPLEEYPELSVCAPAVHDSSTLREWWEHEADQSVFSGFIGYPSLPKCYNPGVARIILQKIAAAASRFRVFQIQDLLHLSLKWYAADPSQERVNVPGTVSEFNWTYRLPASIEELGKDKEFTQGVIALSEIEPVKKRKISHV